MIVCDRFGKIYILLYGSYYYQYYTQITVLFDIAYSIAPLQKINKTILQCIHGENH